MSEPITRYNKCKQCLYQWETQGIPQTPCPMCKSRQIGEITKARYDLKKRVYTTAKIYQKYGYVLLPDGTHKKIEYPGEALWYALESSMKSKEHQIGLID